MAEFYALVDDTGAPVSDTLLLSHGSLQPHGVTAPTGPLRADGIRLASGGRLASWLGGRP
jgi:hypothetical protein